MSSIKSLIDYATEYDSLYEESVIGAEAAKVEKLDNLSGVKLPEEYRDFLCLMGEDQSWIRINESVHLNIDSVLKFYEEHGNEISRLSLLNIAYSEEECLFLETKENSGKVLSMKWGGEPEELDSSFETAKVIASNLTQLYALNVFDRFELQPIKRADYALIESKEVDDRAYIKVNAFLISEGFEKLWFSDNEYASAYRMNNDSFVKVLLDSGH